MVSKSSTNPRLRSPKSNKSEAKWMLHFYCNLNSISGRPFVTSLISGRPHSSIHMPFGQNSLEKFTGKRVKKEQEKEELEDGSSSTPTRSNRLHQLWKQAYAFAA